MALTSVGMLRSSSALDAPDSVARSAGMRPCRKADSELLYRIMILTEVFHVVGTSAVKISASMVGTMMQVQKSTGRM